MKKKYSLVTFTLLSLALCCCSNNVDYVEKDINVYDKAVKNADETITPVSEKTFKVRFYNDYPNVPFTNVFNYFKEFFKTELIREVDGNTYKYTNPKNDFIAFNTHEDVFFTNSLYSFNDHPDFTSTTGKFFLNLRGIKQTPGLIKTIKLGNYSIDVKGDGKDAYVPLSLLSKMAGGFNGYNIAYNGKDLYVIDQQSQLTPEKRNSAYYGNKYYEVLDDFTTKRPADLINYTYNELCFVFDNLRGFTSQLELGDNNLLSLGLNGTLELYNPKVKEYLLSPDKFNYYVGLFTLFGGLNDGGHTACTCNTEGYKEAGKQAAAIKEFTEWSGSVIKTSLIKQLDSAIFNAYKADTLNIPRKDFNENPNYYLKDDESKTAYIGFGHFEVNYRGWNDYYTDKGDIPTSGDTYSFIREKFYQAKNDGIKNLVIDLTSNGGGDSAALMGIVGLLNGAKADFSMNDTVSHFRTTEMYDVDINLDGAFDEADVEELKGFNFNVGVLTSSYSFSCGNLLPSVLKELEYKIIGEKSGGGSCAIILESTADGVPYGHSSYRCLSDASGHNIDSGVETDYPIERISIDEYTFDPSNFFDLAKIGEYLSTAYQNE